MNSLNLFRIILLVIVGSIMTTYAQPSNKFVSAIKRGCWVAGGMSHHCSAAFAASLMQSLNDINEANPGKRSVQDSDAQFYYKLANLVRSEKDLMRVKNFVDRSFIAY
ncbi:hypothetical protein SNEBB_003080 [Seison nebaliae]|nr:hypothetical protein SNEBB_003080 [Seison nebaliae]